GFEPLSLVVPAGPIGHRALADQVQALTTDAPLGVGTEARDDRQCPGQSLRVGLDLVDVDAAVRIILGEEVADAVERLVALIGGECRSERRPGRRVVALRVPAVRLLRDLRPRAVAEAVAEGRPLAPA